MSLRQPAQLLYETLFAAIHFSLLMHAERKVGRLPCGPTMLCKTPFAAFHLTLLVQAEQKVGGHMYDEEGRHK